MLPNFLIIGAPRSGTTWLAKNLMEHSQVFVPRCKEVHFFDRHYEEGIDWYSRYFRNVSSEISIGEGTPAYLSVPSVAPRIRKELGDIRLIAILRNPVDRLYSRHCVSIGRFPEQRSVTFEERIQNKHHLVEEGYYFEHLTRYLALFSRESLKVTFYEDLKENPVEFLRQIFDFLGVDCDVDTVAACHVLNSAAAKPLNAKSRWLYLAQKAARRIGLAALADDVDKLNRNELPTMARSTRERLIRDEYGERNERLAELLSVDLSHWNDY